jgi:hypothetical protein
MAKLQATTFPMIGSGTMLSSITGLIKNHILARLPKNYIKYVYIKNSIASVTERNRDEEMKLIKEKPSLSLGLNYAYNEPVSFGDQMPWGMSRIPVRAYQRTSIYRPVLLNDIDNMYISTIDERIKLNFDVGIRVDSETQAYNLLMYMKSYIGVNRPYYLNRANLEVPMPINALNLIIKSKGFDISTPQGLMDFHDYLTKWSGGQITYKKNLGSGNMNYFMKFSSNVLCKITDMPTIDKTMEGKSVLDAIVRYNIEVELVNFTNFISEHEELQPLPEPPLLIGETGNTMVYNFTAKMPFTRQLDDGKVLAVTLDFITDLNSAIDITSFDDALRPDVRYFIEHQLGLIPDEANAILDHTKIRVLRDHEDLIEDDDFTVDWSKKEVSILHPRTNYVYTLALYLDLTLYNSVVRERDRINRGGEDGSNVVEIPKE